MLAAARMHLSSRGQPDTLTAHFEYPNRTTTGPAVVVIEDVKLGRQLTTLHLTLWQGGLLSQAPWIDTSASRRSVLGYSTHTNLRTFTGISMPTGYEVTPAAALPSLPDFEALKTNGADDHWEKSETPNPPSGLLASLHNWKFYVPRQGPLSPGVLDMWIRMSNGEHITQTALAYVADSFPYNLHTFLATPELRELLNAPPERADNSQVQDVRRRDQQRVEMWFPTVVLNLEAKMALPEEGTGWLAVRVTSKQIRDGRFDLDVLVRDVDGEIVALSHHVAMILSIDRNTGKRGDAMKASL
jgi:Thioesterase-like superfamily